MNNTFKIFLAGALCALCVIFYSYNNMEKIYYAKAEAAFKNKNVQEALFYYEKAFENGLADLKARKNYASLLINSPMTIKNQERLAKIAQAKTDDSASDMVNYFFYDIRHQINRKYPENYIKHCPLNQKVVRWGKLPITYGYTDYEGVPEYFIEEIDNAFHQWEKATGHLILFEKTNLNPNIIIKFRENNPAAGEYRKYVVAYTTPEIKADKLINTNIDFYLKDPKGEYFTKNQIYYTALHEIVHALGFIGHSDEREDVMYMSKDSQSVADDSRGALSRADINTVKLLYNIKPDITNTDETKSEYIPYLVLGEDKDVTSTKIANAKAYIKRAPNLPMGYIDLAAGYLAVKDYAKAIKNLQKALALADTEEIRAMIYFNMAIVYYQADAYDNAEKALKNSVEIKDSEEKQHLLAEIHTKQNKTELAIKEYNALIKNNPKEIEYAVSLANIYVLQKKYMSARKVLKNHVQHNPADKNSTRFSSYGIIKMCL